MTESILPSIRAWCVHYGAPNPGEPDEQMRFRAQPAFVSWLHSRTIQAWPPSGSPGAHFNRDPLPVHPAHQWPGAAARESYRECIAYCGCQIVLFLSLVGAVLAYQIDFDEENPLGGGLPAIQHLSRIIKRRFFGGETKAAAVARGLRKRGIYA